MSKKLNKVLSGFLALSMLATPVLSVNAEVVENVTLTEETETLYGDINSDGVVNSSDMDILKKAIFGIGSLTESEFLSADLNADGKLNSFDLAKISKLVKEKRNLRVVEDCDDTVEDLESSFYNYGRYSYSLQYHDYKIGNTIKLYYQPYLYLNGIKQDIFTALENDIVTVDELRSISKDIRVYPPYYFNFYDVKVIPPADGVNVLPAVEYLYNDGKYDYYFNNILSGLFIIEMQGKQYTLREVINNQLLTPGEMVSLGLFDSKVSAPFEKIETIEIYDPTKDPNFDEGLPQAIQLIYQDEEYGYVLGALYGQYITVTINGIDFSLKEVLQNELLTIHELIDAGFSVGIVDVDEVFYYHFTL